MDLEQLKHLLPEQQELYMNMERLFESPGWATVKGWAKANASDQEARQLHATTWDHTNIARGARLAFRMMEELQETMEAEFAGLAAQNAEAVHLVGEYDAE